MSNKQTYNQKEFNVLCGFHPKYSNFDRNHLWSDPEAIGGDNVGIW